VTAGIALTGGASRRFGRDKATLVHADGETWAARAVALLGAVCDPVIEVGPGHSGAPAVREDPPGGGPVAALLAGVAVVGAPVVLLACDHPAMTAAVLDRLAHHPGSTLVPIVGGRPQYVAARYGPDAVERLRASFAAGDASFRALDLATLESFGWCADFASDAAAFADVDSPDDLPDMSAS
jgi:molybdopterin-guanine dinucleotide biosynthesis protein A